MDIENIDVSVGLLKLPTKPDKNIQVQSALQYVTYHDSESLSLFLLC